jgi:hypothetical protein
LAKIGPVIGIHKFLIHFFRCLQPPNFFGWFGPEVLAGSGNSAGESSAADSCLQGMDVCISTLYSTSAHRKEKKLKFILQIGYAVL